MQQIIKWFEKEGNPRKHYWIIVVKREGNPRGGVNWIIKNLIRKGFQKILCNQMQQIIKWLTESKENRKEELNTEIYSCSAHRPTSTPQESFLRISSLWSKHHQVLPTWGVLQKDLLQSVEDLTQQKASLYNFFTQKLRNEKKRFNCPFLQKLSLKRWIMKV